MKDGMIIGASNIVDLIFESVFSEKPFSATDAIIYPEIDSIIKRIDELGSLILPKQSNSILSIGEEILESYQKLLLALNREIDEAEIKQLYLVLDLKAAALNSVIKKAMSNILVRSVVEFVKHYEPCLDKNAKEQVQRYITQIEMDFAQQISEEHLMDA